MSDDAGDNAAGNPADGGQAAGGTGDNPDSLLDAAAAAGDGGDGGGGPWYSTMDESLHETAKQFDGPESVLKTYVETRRQVPDTADGYKLELPEGEAPLEAAERELITQTAHKLGLDEAGAMNLLQIHRETRAEEKEANDRRAKDARVSEMQTNEAALRKELGEGYDQLMADVNRALGGDEAFTKAFKDAGLASNIAVMKRLGQLGAMIGEAALHEGSGRPDDSQQPLHDPKTRQRVFKTYGNMPPPLKI